MDHYHRNDHAILSNVFIDPVRKRRPRNRELRHAAWLTLKTAAIACAAVAALYYVCFVVVSK